MGDGIPSPDKEHEMRKIPELVCPAGNLPALKTAVDNGADTVYMGLKDATNARNFPGLNFDMKSAREGVAYAHARGRNVLMAINTFAQAGQVARWYAAVDTAAELGADAVIVADPAVMAYVAERYPNLRLHMSVQGSATNYEAINMMKELFGVRRAVLPRVLTVDQVKHVIDNTDVEIEVFGFGSLCVMVEGRCILSSYATGESPNMQGVCSPAKAVRWEQLPDRMNVRLNQVLIDQYKPDEPAGYPTLCKGRFEVNDETYYALEEPTSLNVLEMLPELIKIGVSAIKIEGRQRSPMYTAQVTKSLRQALDAAAANPEHFKVNPLWNNALSKVYRWGRFCFSGRRKRCWNFTLPCWMRRWTRFIWARWCARAARKCVLPTGSAWRKIWRKAVRKLFCRRRCCWKVNPI